MALFASISELEHYAAPILGSRTHPEILDNTQLRGEFLDRLLYTALFTENEELKREASALIFHLSSLCHTPSTSIRPLYQAFGRGDVAGFTVPALNIRTLTYDIARLIFRIMVEKKIGAVIFEIASSEIEYTHQQPQEYAISILAAAIKEGYKGPVFLQGDHYQFSLHRFQENKEQEVSRLKKLIQNSIEAQFYNIDIDASTLVELSQKDLLAQQKLNSEMTALLTRYIREKQPTNHTISIGGEIGHIGDRNSTVEDFKAFMDLYQKEIVSDGLSKVSVQTGTSHGGSVNPDGSLNEMVVDFSILKRIGGLARERYGLGGAVQHGASTLPTTAFDHFVENGTVEIHLATGLQNIIFDNLPADLKDEMYTWIHEHHTKEKKDGESDTQFIYKTRKKAFGPFQQALSELPPEEKQPILDALSSHLLLIFEKLKLFNTRDLVLPYFS